MGDENDIVEQALVEDEKQPKTDEEKKTSKTISVTKILLLIINAITFICGFILLVVGCMYYSNHGSYQDMWNVGSSFCSASIFCIVVGLILCLVSALGFFGALTSNYCCLLAYCVLMSITIFLEMILAVTFFAAITNDNLGSIVSKVMKDSMSRYDQNHKDHGVTKAWNLLQTELKCCGIQTADDWHEDASSLIRWSTSNALPESCCSELAYTYDKNLKTDCQLGSENVYKDGCLPRLREVIQVNGGAIGGVTIVFALIQIGLIVTAFFLMKKVGTSPKTCPPFY